MVMLTPIEITLVLSGEAPAPPPFGRRICLQALPGGEQFILTVQDAQPWQAQLTASQAAQLAGLLARLPTEVPPGGLSSFDGQHYKLVVLGDAPQRVFEWANEDWRRFPPEIRSAWEAVAALTGYVLQLAQRPAAS